MRKETEERCGISLIGTQAESLKRIAYQCSENFRRYKEFPISGSSLIPVEKKYKFYFAEKIGSFGRRCQKLGAKYQLFSTGGDRTTASASNGK